MNAFKKIILSASFLAIGISSQAQEFSGEYANDGYNHHSIRPVNDSHIAWQKSVWYRFSTKEKQNKGFAAKGNELVAQLIEASKNGIIRPYTTDQLNERLAPEEFDKRLKIGGEGLEDELTICGFDLEEDEWDEEGDWETEGTESAEEVNDEYFPKDLYLVEFKENQYFDKKRGRLIHDIESITIKIPAELNPAGIEKTLATYSYKEVCQNLFSNNPEAIWYNEQNSRSHLNFAEAFDLRLFGAVPFKFSNGDDEWIADKYGEGKAGLTERYRFTAKSTENETNLWEN